MAGLKDLAMCVIIIPMENNFQELAEEASAILAVTENYQFELGRISNEIVKNFGYKALTDFSKQIENTGGVRRAPESLRMYAHVFRVSSQLNLPKDILFSVCQAIAFSSDPQKYAKMAQKGASGLDIRHAIWNDKDETA